VGGALLCLLKNTPVPPLAGPFFHRPFRTNFTPARTPIGIPTFEDKVLQRAVARVLEAVYEQDFHDHSYGFRPGRSAHQALKTVWEELSVTQGGWVLELDIEAFLDAAS
jgi:retron-type reverse transcriptase